MTFLEAMALKDDKERFSALDELIQDRFSCTYDHSQRGWVRRVNGILYLLKEDRGWSPEGWTLKAENPKNRKRFKVRPCKTPEDLLRRFTAAAINEREFLEQAILGIEP